MEIEVRKVGQVNVLDLRGNFIRGDGDVKLRARFQELLDAGERRFLLNLRDVPFLDSAAVGETVACVRKTRELEGQIKLLVVGQSKVDDMLRLSALDRILDLHDDEGQALDGFAH